MEVARHCNCNEHSGFCSSCNINISHHHRDTSSSRASSSGSNGIQAGVVGSPGRFFPVILALISGALTALFALAGAFTGAITGALAGRASDSGILRGSGLGAVAGAVLSVEVLEASRAYWCSERSTSPTSPSMADFIEELLHGRLVREQLVPTMFTDYRWQIHIANSSYNRMYTSYDPVASKGLSTNSLKKLPFHLITSENKAGFDGSSCCTICLQDMEVGETVRRLRRCHHMFHLTCVDKWLVRHDSCPVCRQVVL